MTALARESLFAVVRTVGERTTENCHAILADILGDERVREVHEVPFAKSVTSAIQIAVEADFEWTLFVDADCLICPHGLSDLLEAATRLDHRYLGLQGKVVDKFFGGPRDAGVHLYRTSHLCRVRRGGYLENIHKDLRPETKLKGLMEKDGYPWKKIGVPCGLHDFEQYYIDIYRKCFFQARKHPSYVGHLAAYWRQMRTDDTDFAVALQALVEGLTESRSVMANKNDFPQELTEIPSLSSFSLVEKRPLALADFLSGAMVSERIRKDSPPAEYYAMFPRRRKEKKPPFAERLRAEFKATRLRAGLMRSLLACPFWAFGEIAGGIRHRIVKRYL